MDNINGTIYLQLHYLRNVETVDYKGKKCVCIPIDENGIYLTEKGGIYLSFFINKLKEERWGKTHALKRKMSPEEYKNSTKEQRDNMPICGYYEPYKAKDEGNTQANAQAPREGGYNANKPTYQPRPQQASSNSRVDDLPF